MESKARFGKQNGMYGTKGWFPWRNISGLKPHVIGEFKHTEETKNKISRANLKNSTNYWAIHKWLIKSKGKAFGCEKCKTQQNRRYEWSNTSGKHTRNLDDYESLCVPCHRAKDGNNKLYLYSSRYKKHTERST